MSVVWLSDERQGRSSITGVIERDGRKTLVKVIAGWAYEARAEHATSVAAHNAMPWCCQRSEYVTDATPLGVSDPRSEVICFDYVEPPTDTYSDMYTMMVDKDVCDDHINSTIVQVLGCVAAMSAHGITHNDLHVANVLLRKCSHSHVVYTRSDTVVAYAATHGTEPVIIDFGLARMPRAHRLGCLASDHFTELGIACRSRYVDHRYDVAVFLMGVQFLHKQMPQRDGVVAYAPLIEHIAAKKSRPHHRQLKSIEDELIRRAPRNLHGYDTSDIVDMLFILRGMMPIKAHRIGGPLAPAWCDLFKLTGPMGQEGPWDAMEKLRVVCAQGLDQNQYAHSLKLLARMAAHVSQVVNAHNARVLVRSVYNNTVWQTAPDALMLLSASAQRLSIRADDETDGTIRVVNVDSGTERVEEMDGAWREQIVQYCRQARSADEWLTNDSFAGAVRAAGEKMSLRRAYVQRAANMRRSQRRVAQY